MLSEVADEPDWELTDLGYHPLFSRGFVSLVRSDKKVPVTILSESSAYDTFHFLYWSLCRHSPQTVTLVVAPIFGKMGLNVLAVPLHNLFISSNLVKSEVSLGVCPV